MSTIMQRRLHFISVVTVMLLALCQSACRSFTGTREELTAARIDSPIALDGHLNEIVWHKTPAYPLKHTPAQFENADPAVRKFFRGGPAEAGKIKLLWDEKYLYVGIECTDSDIVATARKDELDHSRQGDAVTVYIKPLHKTWFWKLQAAPDGSKSSFFCPGYGLFELPGISEKPALRQLKSAASVKGTLNNVWDRDKKWCVEMAVPRAEIGMAGEKLEPGIPWLVFVERINYGRCLPAKEKSCFPYKTMRHSCYFDGYGLLKMKQ